MRGGGRIGVEENVYTPNVDRHSPGPKPASVSSRVKTSYSVQEVLPRRT